MSATPSGLGWVLLASVKERPQFQVDPCWGHHVLCLWSGLSTPHSMAEASVLLTPPAAKVHPDFPPRLQLLCDEQMALGLWYQTVVSHWLLRVLPWGCAGNPKGSLYSVPLSPGKAREGPEMPQLLTGPAVLLSSASQTSGSGLPCRTRHLHQAFPPNLHILSPLSQRPYLLWIGAATAISTFLSGWLRISTFQTGMNFMLYYSHLLPEKWPKNRGDNNYTVKGEGWEFPSWFSG